MSFAVRPIGLVKSAFVWRPTISADATNYHLKAQALAAGWDGVVPLDAIVTVNSGIALSANATNLYGFDTGDGFPVGTTLKLIMPGYVCGMGGAGGSYSNGANGLPGGPALRAQHAISIDAAGGVIAGGGGGGGRGLDAYDAGGGGGRSGRTNSAGGTAYYSGKPGTAFVGGDGGSYGPGPAGGTTGPGTNALYNGQGGGGGGWGAAGGAGRYNGNPVNGSAGGAAVVGNSYITWINTGTRYGSIT